MLAVNTWDEPREALAGFAREHSLRQTILLDGSEVDKSLGGVGVPTVLWIDKEGIVRDVLWGAGSETVLQRKTKKLLDQS